MKELLTECRNMLANCMPGGIAPGLVAKIDAALAQLGEPAVGETDHSFERMLRARQSAILAREQQGTVLRSDEDPYVQRIIDFARKFQQERNAARNAARNESAAPVVADVATHVGSKANTPLDAAPPSRKAEDWWKMLADGNIYSYSPSLIAEIIDDLERAEREIEMLKQVELGSDVEVITKKEISEMREFIAETKELVLWNDTRLRALSQSMVVRDLDELMAANSTFLAAKDSHDN